MTEDEAIAKFNEILEEHKSDIELVHFDADKVLLAMVPPRVAEAYEALVYRVDGFWYA